MDWVVHSLDHISKKQLGCGNSFLIAVELTGEFKADEFQEIFSKYCSKIPHLRGRVARDFNLAPYWRLQTCGQSSEFIFKMQKASSREEAFKQLETELNILFQEDQLPVKTLAIWLRPQTILGFIFDHRLFDARGGELFLKGFQSFYLANGKDPDNTISPAPACLDRWSEQFAAGKKVNRSRIAREKNPIRFLAGTNSTRPTANRFKVKTFTEEQTLEIFERSEKRAGPFMFLPYSLACASRAMHVLFSAKGQKQGDFIIPVTRDMRANRSAPSMLFNHLS